MDSDTSQTSADGSHACCDELIELVAKLRTELHKKDEELEQKKQELAWKHANFSKMAMDSSTQTSADHHTCICSKIFEVAENLRIELHKKDEELAKEKQEKQKLSTDLALENAQATKFKTEWDSAQKMIHNHQMGWDLFPLRYLYYLIETHSGSSNGEFLYLSAESQDYYLRSSPGDQFPGFVFTKNTDGTFMLSSEEKYLHTNTNTSRVEFTANKDNAGKFVLFFHQQNHHIGLLVDISTLDGYFLCIDNDNYVVANSRTPPALTDKFMITLLQ